MFSEIALAFNRGIRTVATNTMRRFAIAADGRKLNLRDEAIEKILLVRPNFRMGNSILAIPSIQLFRRSYPTAQIDFVGSPVSKALCANLPIDHHYEVARRFPKSSWAYPVLLRKLRRENYDLAVEVSCSQSALGAFVVGLSGARLKVGREGKWDFWYDVKISKPAQSNKYRMLPAFLAAMGLESEDVFPKIILSPAEIEAARKTFRSVDFNDGTPILGIFVGGRERHGKRWPANRFNRLVQNLTAQGVRVVVFLGPEERELITYYVQSLRTHAPVILEPSLRKFAAMISQCQLFLTCDSGPMHLACALGVRMIAIFQNKDFNRWAPPPGKARIMYDPQGTSVAAVEAECLAAWSELTASQGNFRSEETFVNRMESNPRL